VLLQEAEGRSWGAVSSESPLDGDATEVVVGDGEAGEAGGSIRGILLSDGEPKGRSSENVRVHRPVSIRERAAVLRSAPYSGAGLRERL
jgi:hypothetical protein